MQLPFHFIYCKAAMGGKKEKTKNPKRKQAVPKGKPVRFIFRQAQGSRLAPEPTSGAGQAVEFAAARV